jgi:hypothetical protein
LEVDITGREVICNILDEVGNMNIQLLDGSVEPLAETLHIIDISDIMELLDKLN